MRLVCIHADTVDALKRLSIELDDLTPTGLWSSQYHLVGLTPEQMDALEVFQVQVEDVTPPQLAQAGRSEASASTRAASTSPRASAQATAAAPTHGTLAGAMAVPQATHDMAVAAPIAASADQSGREAPRVAPDAESEVPLAQTRDSGARAGEVKAESKPDWKGEGKQASQTAQAAGAASSPRPASTGGQQPSGQKNTGGKGGGAPAQGNRKGQPQAAGQGGGQRYGTTRLRISVAGKYTEATVANGKIVVGGRSFDSPDQAAAELTKSRGDWTFWEYYDSTDGKWRMLTRDWDTVLKSAAPGGR
jgi:hypothetical protein